MDTLEITLLGHFYLRYCGESIETLRTARQQALLAYLLLHRQEAVDRGLLASLFWPETSDSQARSNLRTLFHRVRSLLPDADHYLRIDRATVGWRPSASFYLDVADFEYTLSQATSADAEADPITVFTQAVSLYGGKLLPHLYDDWLYPHRKRLHTKYVDALQALRQFHEEQRDYRKALDYGQRVLDEDLLNEDAYRHLIRLNALASNQGRALQLYADCVNVLERELGIEPAADLQSMADRLRRRTYPIVDPSATLRAPAVPLIGRSRQWSSITKLWTEPMSPSPHLILLTGEPGIGKTRLLREVAEWADRQGHDTVQFRCYVSSVQMAYAPVVDWLRTQARDRLISRLDEVWLVELSRLLPELRILAPDLPEAHPLTADWQRQQLYVALAEAIFPAVQESDTYAHEDVLLGVDDIQWCDGETLNWLHWLLAARRAKSDAAKTEGRMLVVGTQRLGEEIHVNALPALLANLRSENFLTELALDRLSPSETAQLVEALDGKIANVPLSEQIFAVTEGNPLFIVECMRAAKAETLVLQGEVEASLGGGLKTDDDETVLTALPNRILALLQTRFSRLTPAARRVAAMAATIGRKFTLDVLNAAASVERVIDQATLVQGLDELWKREIIHEAQIAAYDFSHGLLREAALLDQSTASRRLYHRYAAEGMLNLYAANVDAFCPQIASHYERAGMAEASILYYRRAASAAESIYAHESALRFLERAIELHDSVTALAQEGLMTDLLEELGDIYDFLGHHEKARTVFRQALWLLTQYEAIEHSRLLRKIGKTYEGQRDFDAALTSYAEAESSLQERPTKSIPAWWRAWIQLQLERLWVYYWINAWQKSYSLATEIELSIEQYATPLQRISYYLVRATTLMLQYRYRVPSEALRLTEAALLIAEEIGDQGQIAWARFIHGFALLWRRDLDQAQSQIAEALSGAEQTGDLVHQARCTTYLAIIRRMHGDVEATRSYADLALETARIVQMVEYEATALANLGWIAWREGNMTVAYKQLERALALWRQLPEGHPSAAVRWTASFPLLAIAMTEGRLNDAVAHAVVLLDPVIQRLPDELDALLTSAIEVWQCGDEHMASNGLAAAVEEAQTLGYL